VGYGYPSLVYQDPVFEYTGNLTWVKGNHNIRFGMDVSQQHMNHKEVSPTQFNFTGGLTGSIVPTQAALAVRRGDQMRVSSTPSRTSSSACRRILKTAN
jgi:hypothetical protein